MVYWPSHVNDKPIIYSWITIQLSKVYRPSHVNDKPVIYSWIRVQLSKIYWPSHVNDKPIIYSWITVQLSKVYWPSHVNDKPIIYSWIRVQLSMVYWPCKNQTPYIKWLHLYSSCNSSKVVRDSSLVSGIHLFFVVQKITKKALVAQYLWFFDWDTSKLYLARSSNAV